MSKSEALAWIAGIFDQPADAISPETSRDQIETWDSIGTLTLMAELDERFDLTVDEEVLAGLDSIGSLLKMLEDHGLVG